MKKWFKNLFRSKQKGEIEISPPIIIVTAIILIFAVSMVGVLNTITSGIGWSITGAISYLNQNGYTATTPVGTVYTDTILPNADSTWDIGASGTEFADVYFDTVHSPVGRGATYVVAASNATATSIAQADYQCDGTADDEQIQAAIDACNSTGFGSVKIVSGTYTCSQIVMKSNVEVVCDNGVTINITIFDTAPAMLWDDLTNSIWRGGLITREGSTAGNVLTISGTTDDTCQIFDVEFRNNASHAGNDSFGILINETAAPKLWNVIGKGAISSLQNTAGWRIQGSSTPELHGCKGVGGDGTGTRAQGIYIRESSEPILYDCIGIGGANVSEHSQGIVINGAGNTVKCFNCIGIGGGGTKANGWEVGDTPYVILHNCEGYGGTNSRGLSIDNSLVTGLDPIADNGEIFGGYFEGGTGTNSFGLYLIGPTKIRTNGAHFKGGTGTTCHGGYVADGALLEDNGSTFEGGATDGCGLFDSSIGGEYSSSIFLHSYAGAGNFSQSLRIDKSNSKFYNCVARSPRSEGAYTYTGTTYSIVPIASQAYMLIGLALNVTTAVGGADIDIGTSDGGTEIAANITAASTGWKWFDITKAEIAADTAFYVKPSNTSVRYDLYWIVIPNDANQYALYYRGAYTDFGSCSFISNGASDAAYIETTISGAEPSRYQFNHCHFETLDSTNQNSVTLQAAKARQKFNKCTFIGAVSNVTSFYNLSYAASGDIVSISKVIDHASLTDNADATAYIDFDDAIPAGSIIKAVQYDFTEAFNSDDTTTLTVMIGSTGDLDAFSLTVDPGDNAFNHTTDVYWGESDCQAHRVTSATTPRVTFTEDDDGTDIINSVNAQGGITIYITYMKT